MPLSFSGPVKSEYFEVTFHSDNNINGRGFYAAYNIHSGVEATLLTQPSIISGQGESCFSDSTKALDHVSIAFQRAFDHVDKIYFKIYLVIARLHPSQCFDSTIPVLPYPM